MKIFPTFFILNLTAAPIGVKVQTFYASAINKRRSTIGADDKRNLELSSMIEEGFRYAYEALHPFGKVVKATKVTHYHDLDFDIVKYKPHYEVPKPWERFYFSESVIVRNFNAKTPSIKTTPVLVQQMTNETVFETIQGTKTTQGFKVSGKINLKKLPIELNGEYSKTTEISILETNRVLSRELFEIRTSPNNIVVQPGKARVFLSYIEYKKHQIKIPVEAIVSGQIEGIVTLTNNVKVKFKTNMELIGSMLEAHGYEVEKSGKNYFFPALITLNRSIHQNIINAEFHDFDSESQLQAFLAQKGKITN